MFDMSEEEQHGATETETLVRSLSKASEPWLCIRDINHVSVLSGMPLTLAACEIKVYINLPKVPENLRKKDNHYCLPSLETKNVSFLTKY